MQRVPLRIVVNGIGGIGKTSFAAQFPEPIFIQSRGESGLQTLEAAGIVSAAIMPFTDRNGETFYEAQTYQDVLDAVEWLTKEDHEYKTLVFDVANGIERLIHEHECQRNYKGDWGEKGFMSFHKGFDSSMVHVKEFTNRLDVLRSKRTMTVVMLAHTKVGSFKNPLGPDYDRYVPDMHAKTWGWLFGWADVVLFANRVVSVDTQRATDRKGKADSISERILYTEAGPAWDAKNRNNLPSEISMGSSAREAFDNFVGALKQSKELNKAQA